jgi:hypothetical protein
MPEALRVAAIPWGSIPLLLLISLAVMGSPYLIGIIVGITVVLVSDPMNVIRLPRTTFAPRRGL